MTDNTHVALGIRLIRTLKTLLILSVALWALLGLLSNIADWSGTTASVKDATSMSTFAGGSASWRASTSPVIIDAGAVFIVFFKIISASLCLLGAWRMWSTRSSGSGAFENARSVAVAGCMTAVLGLFLGWIVIGEGWFQLWRSDTLREAACQTAFRYGGLIAVIGLLVSTREHGPSYDQTTRTH